MALALQDAAEVYAAVSLLVVGADGLGTLEERHFLFEELGEIDVFEGHDEEGLGAMLGRLVGKIHAEASDGEGPPGSDVVTSVCASARETLDEGQRLELFSLAVRLAYSDGLDNAERAMLAEISKGLGVDAESARAMIDRTTD